MVSAIEKTNIKWKKKKWIDIVGPALFKEKKVGETYVKEIDKMLGCTVKASVAQLTGNMKKQNLLLTLKCTKFEGEKAKTEVVSFELEKSYVSRLAKKGVSKVSDSFISETKDGKKVRVKPILVTQSRVKSSIGRSLHVVQREGVDKYVRENTFDDIVSDVIGFKMQSALKTEFTKVFPIRHFQVRFFGLVK